MTREAAGKGELPSLAPLREEKIAAEWERAEREAKEAAKYCRERREEIRALEGLAAEYRLRQKEAKRG